MVNSLKEPMFEVLIKDEEEIIDKKNLNESKTSSEISAVQINKVNYENIIISRQSTVNSHASEEGEERLLEENDNRKYKIIEFEQQQANYSEKIDNSTVYNNDERMKTVNTATQDNFSYSNAFISQSNTDELDFCFDVESFDKNYNSERNSLTSVSTTKTCPDYNFETFAANSSTAYKFAVQNKSNSNNLINENKFNKNSNNNNNNNNKKIKNNNHYINNNKNNPNKICNKKDEGISYKFQQPLDQIENNGIAFDQFFYDSNDEISIDEDDDEKKNVTQEYNSQLNADYDNNSCEILNDVIFLNPHWLQDSLEGVICNNVSEKIEIIRFF
jgi:hypothetical protein